MYKILLKSIEESHGGFSRQVCNRILIGIHGGISGLISAGKVPRFQFEFKVSWTKCVHEFVKKIVQGSQETCSS